MAHQIGLVLIRVDQQDADPTEEYDMADTMSAQSQSCRYYDNHKLNGGLALTHCPNRSWTLPRAVASSLTRIDR